MKTKEASYFLCVSFLVWQMPQQQQQQQMPLAAVGWLMYDARECVCAQKT